MQVITDTLKEKELIEQSIKKHGFFAEHNYRHFQHSETKNMKNIFFSFDDGMGIMAKKTKNRNWHMFGSVLAPKEKQLGIFMQFLDYAFSRENANKVQVEVLKGFREELKKRLRKSSYRPVKLNYSLAWPVYNMEEWDGDRLEGKKWKKIRNLKNTFLADNNVEVVDSRTVGMEKLKQVAYAWVKERGNNDRALIRDYINLIESNFEGCDNARTVLVNGEPCSITAGWKIPNTECYYSAVGIFNYSHRGLGEFCNLDDLVTLKRQGHKFVDFGGSDRPLLEFKKKFRPSSTYDTFIFSIKKKPETEKQKTPAYKQNAGKTEFKVVKDIKECKKLWDMFSTKKNVWDLWEFNSCFFSDKTNTPYFIVGYENSMPVGILPLMHDKKEGNYGFFGGEFPENRNFYLNDKTKLKHFLDMCPQNTYLYYISESELEYFNFEEQDPKYCLDLREFGHSLTAYFATFNKKHRKNLRYDLKHLEKLNYAVLKNRLEDYNIMVEFNKQRFVEESDFSDPGFAGSMKTFVTAVFEKGMLSMISVDIGGKVAGVELAVQFNNVYTVLGGGRDMSIKNIGKLLIIEHIKEAINLKADIIDFCTTESGWKELWNLKQVKLAQFEKESKE